MIKETKNRKIVGWILIALCVIPFISMFVNSLLTVPTGVMILYFLGRNAYILLKKEEDTQIEAWKIFLFYLVEILVCIIVSFIAIWIFDEGDAVLLPVVVYPILVIILTLVYPANKFFKNCVNAKNADTSINEVKKTKSIDEKDFSVNQDDISVKKTDDVINLKKEEMENQSINVVEKVYSSLYEELKEKCNPQNFMSPYDAEKVKFANELYAELIDCAKDDDVKLRNLRDKATHLLGIKFSTSYLFDFLLSYCNPALYFNVKPYPKEFIDKANEYYNKLLSNKDNITALEEIKEETKDLFEWRNQHLKDSSDINPITEKKDNYDKIDRYKTYLILCVFISGVVIFLLAVAWNNADSEISYLDRRLYSMQNTIEKNNKEKDSVQNELNIIRSVVDNFGNTCPILIKDVKMGNVYYNSNIETDYGKPIYSSNTMFLEPKIEYIGSSSQKIKLYWKLYYPSGRLSRGESSPTNYSNWSDISIHTGKGTVIGTGWGNSKKGNWGVGEYKLEFYYSDSLIYTHKFTIF
ncbi:MAG: APC family permease [Bacteroidales bacterium]|nr:APC family permease [Bacteroidales bacterium]